MASPSARSSSVARRSAQILAVSNQKGGVGKTTTAVNLAASLAAAEHEVLLVDLDPQGNASSSVGFPRDAVEIGTYDLLMGEASLEDAQRRTELPTLSVVAASPDLLGAEIELVGVPDRESRLQRALLRGHARERFDFVIFDCPPSLGLLTLNGLVAADRVLIPMLARYFSLEGLGALTRTIEAVRAALNPELSIEGIVFCNFDKRTNLAQQVVAEVHKHFPERVFKTYIPQNIRLSESPSHGKPALLYDITSKGAQAYLDLARELLARGARRTSAKATIEPAREQPARDVDRKRTEA
ncbi:MAG: AAA family ATPase [Nannocystaceae bacterium]